MKYRIIVLSIIVFVTNNLFAQKSEVDSLLIFMKSFMTVELKEQYYRLSWVDSSSINVNFSDSTFIGDIKRDIYLIKYESIVKLNDTTWVCRQFSYKNNDIGGISIPNHGAYKNFYLIWSNSKIILDFYEDNYIESIICFSRCKIRLSRKYEYQEELIEYGVSF